ncbi:hypothetical protein [Mycobacterium sp. 1245801.1]|uniref:hypothetical protein n=1 Tax=Mycobacterium sp. 1245801.1 TaxID=1834075 RepID=UPI0007FB87E1|nr:hypothetical protein [Mycobacterium sp. 1245801.1]OBJ14597.1 hypothetical protein A5622_03730 [Mycobacterium sp. 1245801.1]
MAEFNPWHFIDKYPGQCAAEVSRKGNSEPCDEAAYAVAMDDEGFWPVCIKHARGQGLVPLSEVLEHRAG